MAMGVFLELPRLGATWAVAGLSFLYLPPASPRYGAPVVLASAFAMAISYASGLVGSIIPTAAALLLGCVAAGASLFCKTQALVPPGPLPMVIAAAIGAFSAADTSSAAQALGYFIVGCIWSCAISGAYIVCISRNRTLFTRPVLPGSAVIESILTGLFVGLSLEVAALLDLQKPYWVPITCAAVMQGFTLRASVSRNVHRMVGTIMGAGLTWLLVPVLANAWSVVAAVTILTFLVEMTVLRNYAFAALFFTPLGLLLAESGSSGLAGPGGLIGARLVDTFVGALIGLFGAICLHSGYLSRLTKFR
jgi:Fusaric acid resistance protein-like